MADTAESAENSSASDASDRVERILGFERQLWKNAGAKEEAIRSQFGLSAARYYQMLNAVLDQPSALLFDPMLVKRLHRIRDSRTEARAARVLDPSGRETTD